MSTVDTRINGISSSSSSSSPFSGQISIGNIINSAGSLFKKNKKSNVNNKSKTEILKQASSNTGGSTNGSMLEMDTRSMIGAGITATFAGLESSLPAGVALTQTLSSNGMDNKSKVGAGITGAFAGLESSLPGGIPLTQILSSGKIPDFSNMSVNVTDDGKGSSGNSDKTQNKNSYSNQDFTKMTSVGLIEKKDSPVRLEVGKEKIDNFFLTTVNYEMKEKVQTMSMLDTSDIIYFFGDSPIIVSLTGICLDTYNYEWLRTMVDLYKNKMRGTMSVSKATKVRVSYDEEIVEGVVINMNVNKTAASLNTAELRFTMIITDTMSTAFGSLPTAGVTTVTAEDITREARSNIANRAAAPSINDYIMLNSGSYSLDSLPGMTNYKKIAEANSAIEEHDKKRTESIALLYSR